MARRRIVLSILFVVAVGALPTAQAAGPPIPPPGFADATVVSVAAPTALAFTPDGRLLIASQSGQLRVYQNGALLPNPALDLAAAAVICANHERGLLSVAVDPNFVANQFVYLFYTFNKYPAGNCPDAQPSNPENPVNRVVRVTLPANNQIDLASQTILIDNIPSTNGNHNAGDLHFGKDGNLYISVGDGGADYTRNHAQASGNFAARDQFILLGKILRIRPDGTLPPDNPWMGADSARCYDPAPGGNQTARNADNKKCRETFAWGLRNPFRMAFDPNAATTRFFINDVGQNTWEEIDAGSPGADYGWNTREGPCRSGSGASTDCGPPPAGMTNPIFAYQHGSSPNNCNAISGGAFVPNGVWPVEYDGAYLFADYVCGRLFRLQPDGQGGYTRADFVTNVGAAIALTFGPFGGGQALYYTTFANGGQVHRVTHTGSANRAPSAGASATPTSGDAPLNVSFSAATSSDPDGDPLSYEWDFGDGTLHASIAAPSHVYAAGTYTATLLVNDGKGAKDSASIRIDSGNSVPEPQISGLSPGFRFRVGQSIQLQGSASDAQDGELAPGQLTWRALLHHNDHTHPYAGPVTGNTITLTAPPPEDLAATARSYLEIQLSATDSHGLTSVITRELQPNLVNISLATAPVGLSLTVNDTQLRGPQTLVSWEGYVLALAAPQQTTGTTRWSFANWSDGGSAAHTVITPAVPRTFTATFTPQLGYWQFIPAAAN